MRLLVLLALSCLPSFAGVCNPTSHVTGTGCPVLCPATLGSTTPVTIPGTAWTQQGPDGVIVSTSGIDCTIEVAYGTGSTCAITMSGNFLHEGCFYSSFWAHGQTNVMPLFMWHGGGFVAGTAEGAMGNINGTDDTGRMIVETQLHMADPNVAGTRGYLMIAPSYTLAANTAATAFPMQWQQAKCAYWTAVANPSWWPTAEWSVIGAYGPSAGAPFAWWMAATSDTAYTASCPVSAPTTPPARWLVGAWFPTDFMAPTGTANWDKTFDSSAMVSALQGLFNCVGVSACRTAAALVNPEPYLNVTSAANIPTLIQFGDVCQINTSTHCDQLILPYWSGQASGNLPLMTSAYAAAGIPLQVYILNGEIHEGDLNTFVYPSGDSASLTAMFSFFGGRPVGPRQMLF